MPTGSCLCGDIRYEYSGEPKAKALCHCDDCQKITGSAFSTNALIPESNFKIISGEPAKYTKTADSGNTITSFFCSKCGSTQWRETKTFEGLKIVKSGSLDSKSDYDKLVPGLELFERNKAAWIPAFPDTQKQETM